MAEDAFRTGILNKRPYDEWHWSGHYVPVAGKFLAAIKRAVLPNDQRKALEDDRRRKALEIPLPEVPEADFQE